MRRLRTILTILSFILFLIVVADRISHFWRSNHVALEIVRGSGTGKVQQGGEILSSGGEIMVMINSGGSLFLPRSRLEPGIHLYSENQYIPSRMVQASIGVAPIWHVIRWDSFNVTRFQRTQRSAYIAVSSWFLAALLVILPVRWAWRRHRERNRPRQSLCPNCGYDLRATPDRCPECGRAIVTA